MTHDEIRAELARLLREEQRIWSAGSSKRPINHTRVGEIRERRLALMRLLRQQVSE